MGNQVEIIMGRGHDNTKILIDGHDISALVRSFEVKGDAGTIVPSMEMILYPETIKIIAEPDDMIPLCKSCHDKLHKSRDKHTSENINNIMSRIYERGLGMP